MELEGLSRCVDEVMQYLPHLKVELTTDGHKSVEKWLREEISDVITHYFDVWHVAKGLRKKFKAAVKRNKRLELITKWANSIMNHMYWCAMTSNNNSTLILAKWKSMVNHIVNVHVHEGNELFPKCLHQPGIRKLWFKEGSEEFDKMYTILTNKALLHAVSKLSSDGQTSGLEGYHSTVVHFAPKMYHFGYNGMQSRLELAALHFNENAGRQHSKKKDGSQRYNIRHPKNRYGSYIVVPVPKEPTFAYVDKFLAEVPRLVLTGKDHTISGVQLEPLCSRFERPPKEEAIRLQKAAHAQRFKKV